MKINELISKLEEFAPPSLAEEWDNVGLMLGDGEAELKGVALALDVTDAAVDDAISAGANLIVSHHPLIFRPIGRLDYKDAQSRLIAKLVKADIAVYSMHTNLDKAPCGLNMYLAKRLGGDDARIDDEGGGAIFSTTDKDAAALAHRVSKTLGDDSVRLVGDPKNKVKKAYLVTGSGGGELKRAMDTADVLISGEIKHHQYLEALANGFNIVEFSHYFSEIIMQDVLSDMLKGLPVKITKAASGCPFRRIDEV